MVWHYSGVSVRAILDDSDIWIGRLVWQITLPGGGGTKPILWRHQKNKKADSSVTGHFLLPDCLMLGCGLSLLADSSSSSSWVSRLLHLNWKYTSALLSPQHADCRPWDLSASITTGATPYNKSLFIHTHSIGSIPLENPNTLTSLIYQTPNKISENILK